MSNNILKTSPEEFERDLRLKAYTRDMVNLLLKLRPELGYDKIKEIVSEEVKFRYKSVMPTILVNEAKTDIHNMDRYIMRNNLIVAGSGSLYVQHEGSTNIITLMIDYLKKERSKYKKLKFKCMNEGDEVGEKKYDTLQLVVKIFNNSLYGVLTQPDSIFYNPLSGPSITLSGQDATITAVNIFEKFIANNIFFWDVKDVLVYINNITEEEYKDDRISFKQIKSIENLTEYLLSKMDSHTEEDKKIIMSMLRNIDSKYYNRIYYKSNLNAFIEESNVIDEYFGKVLGTENFLDANEPPEEMKDDLEALWSVLEDHVFYNYQDYHRYENMFEHEGRRRRRKATLTIDTDSNFLAMSGNIQCLRNMTDSLSDIDTNFDRRLSLVNVLMFINTKVITETLYKYCREVGIPHDKVPLLYMKNEFYMSRIMLTKNKKNYASIVKAQEGNLVPPHKQFDMKGLAIKKVNTNKKVREVLSKVLEENILKEDKVNIGKVIKSYKDLEHEIHDSIMQGKLEFALPDKVNSAENYVFPYRIESFRGTVLWNKLFPKNTINTPAKVKKIKLKITLEDAMRHFADNEYYLNVFKEIFNDGNLCIKDTINTIAIPQDAESLPEFLLPFIDVEAQVNANIKAGLVILESIGIQTIPVLTNEFPSTRIKF